VVIGLVGLDSGSDRISQVSLIFLKEIESGWAGSESDQVNLHMFFQTFDRF
jgi:hypothetical protein